MVTAVTLTIPGPAAAVAAVFQVARVLSLESVVTVNDEVPSVLSSSTDSGELDWCVTFQSLP